MAIIDQFQLDRKNITKILIIAFVIIALVVGVYYLYNYLTLGQVTIVSEKNANIYEITIVNGKYNNKVIGTSQVTKKYKPGSYSFVITKDNKSTIQSVQIEARRSYSYQINLLDIPNQNKVLSALANNIQASNDEIRYVNSSYNYLETYKVGNKSPTNYPMNRSVDNISAAQWVGDKKALLKYFNTSYAYLDNRTVQFFSPLPKTSSNNEDSDFTVNQIMMNSNLNILSLLNNEIYLQNSISSQPVKVASDLKAESITMGLSNNYIAYSSSFSLVDPRAGKETNPNTDKNITILKISDKENKKTIKSESNVLFMSFSENSNNLLFINSNGINIYDFESGKNYVVYAKTPEKALITTWVDNDRIIYFDSDGIWLMNIKSQTANKISGGELNRYIVNLSVSLQKNKLYYTIQTPSQGGNNNSVYVMDLKY